MPENVWNDGEQEQTPNQKEQGAQSGDHAQDRGSSSQNQNDQENRNSRDQKDQEKREPETPRKKHRNIFITFSIGLVVVVIAVLWYLHSLTYETTDDAQVDGHLNSIASRIAGSVTGVGAENNQPVRAGQLLIQLDPQDQQVQVEQNRAQYEQALAKLASDKPNVPIQKTSNTSDVAADKANVANGEATVAQAEEDYASNVAKLRQAEAANKKNQMDLIRYKKLSEKHELADSDLDTYIANAGSQQATVDSSRAAAESSAKVVDQRKAQLLQQQTKLREDMANAPRQLQVKQSTIQADEANVASARAQLDSALLNLSYCQIASPVNGIASQRNAEIGARVNAAQQVMVIVQTDYVWVTANFKETQLKKMHPGQSVRVRVDSLGEYFDGEVEFMPSATGDRNSLFPPENATGNYVKVVQRLPVRIKFKPGQRDLDKLRPGMSVEPKVELS